MKGKTMQAPITPLAQLRNYVRPERNPVDGIVVDGNLDRLALLSGVAIYADAECGGQYRAMKIAEDALKAGERVIVIDFARLGFGLSGLKVGNKRVPVLRYGRDVHGYTLSHLDGDGLADSVIHGKSSIVLEIDHLTYGQITIMLTALLERVLTSGERDITVVFVGLDALIARRRHEKDSRALIQFHSLALRGRGRNIKFVITAESPSEIPMEIRNGMKSIISGRLCSKPQVSALQAVVWTENLTKYARTTGIGISVGPVGVHWGFFPSQCLPDMPVLLPPLEFDSGIGNDDGSGKVRSTPEETASIAVLKAAAEARSEAAAGAVSRRSTSVSALGSARRARHRLPEGTGVPRRRLTLDVNGVQVSIQDHLKTNKVQYYAQKANVARLVCAMLKNSMRHLDPTDVTALEIVDRCMHDERVGKAAAWMARREKHNAMIASRLLGVVHFMLGTEAMPSVVSFLDRVLSGADLSAGDPRLALGRALGEMDRNGLPTCDQGRLEALIQCWNAHVLGERMTKVAVTGTLPDMLPPAAARSGEVVPFPRVHMQNAA